MAAHPAGGPALGRVLGERGDLRRARLGARQRRGGPGDGAPRGTPLAVRAGQVDRAEEHHPGAGAEADPGHAAGGPALRADLVGAEAQQLGVAGDEDQVVRLGGSSTAPTTSSPSRSLIDLPRVLVRRVLGVTRLTTPCAVPSASPGEPSAERAQAEQRARPAPARGTRRAARRRTARRARGRRQRRQVQHGQPHHPPAAGHRGRPRRGRSPGPRETITSWLARRPACGRRQRLGVGASGPAARWRTAAPSTGRRRPRAAPPGRDDAAPRPTPAARCGAACRTVAATSASSSETSPRSRRGVLEHRGQLGDRLVQLQPSPRSSSIRQNLVSRRSGISRMYSACDLGEVEHGRSAAPGPARCRRWSG